MELSKAEVLARVRCLEKAGNWSGAELVKRVYREVLAQPDPEEPRIEGSKINWIKDRMDDFTGE
jgi:hypothetical protein